MILLLLFMAIGQILASYECPFSTASWGVHCQEVCWCCWFMRSEVPQRMYNPGGLPHAERAPGPSWPCYCNCEQDGVHVITFCRCHPPNVATFEDFEGSFPNGTIMAPNAFNTSTFPADDPFFLDGCDVGDKEEECKV